MAELHELSAAELSRLYATGAASPVEVTQAVIAHIARWEPQLCALYAYDPKGALGQARDSEARWRAGQALSPLDGVPLTLKENIATKGVPLPAGTAATVLVPATEDAPPAARLREAGCVLLGKTTMPDYGMLTSGLSSFHHLSRNPWDLRLNPGGSSGGAAAAAAAVATAAPKAGSPPLLQSRVSDAELDKTILNASILNGALELLPQSWASMAIIPLQVRLVYRIGKAHGVELDQGHIKEFLATVGVGLTGQYIEQVGRKLVSGLLGKAAGRMIGGLGGAATSVAFSFATTWALGHLAKRYYAGGRVMSTDLLKRTYEELFTTAKGAQQQYLPVIQSRASTLTASEVVDLVRR